MKHYDSHSFAPAYLVEAMNDGMRAAGDACALLQTADDSSYAGRSVCCGGKNLLNFGCCSYLGLELNSSLADGVVNAVRKYGTQFPFPRAMLQCQLYEELETTLEAMTGGNVAIAACTTLAHISALPVLIAPKDAVIVDQFAHASLHTAIALLRNTSVNLIRHSRLDLLESNIKRLTSKHHKIWYVFDGLYSMLGEFAPIDELGGLLDKYPALHIYVDDAHSTSWIGTHGRGYALDILKNRDRVVGALSLNKAFSAAGGVVVVDSKETAMKIRRSGGPMAFSGAIQPPMLGAAVASARLHMTNELNALQRSLAERINLANSLASKMGVPIANDAPTPIFFLRCGPDRKAFDLVTALRKRDICVCAAMYPIVPVNQAGIRFTVTLHNTPEDIHRLMGALSAEAHNLGLETPLPLARLG